MKITQPNAFATAQVGGPAEAGTVKDTSGSPRSAEAMDPERGALLAAFAGPVASQRTYAYTPVRVQQPQPNTVHATAKVQIADVQAALQDQRIPKMNVAVSGNTVTVDGLRLTFETTAEGLRFTGSAVGLQAQTVNAAVEKLACLANVARYLRHLDQNPNIMVDLKISAAADGSIVVEPTARIRVNPKLEKQGDFVFSQHAGGMTMPEKKAAAVAARRARATVTG